MDSNNNLDYDHDQYYMVSHEVYRHLYNNSNITSQNTHIEQVDTNNTGNDNRKHSTLPIIEKSNY